MLDLVRIPRAGDQVRKVSLKHALAIARAPPSPEKLAEKQKRYYEENREKWQTIYYPRRKARKAEGRS